MVLTLPGLFKASFVPKNDPRKIALSPSASKPPQNSPLEGKVSNCCGKSAIGRSPSFDWVVNPPRQMLSCYLSTKPGQLQRRCYG